MKMSHPKKISFLGRLPLLPGSNLGRNFGPYRVYFALVAPSLLLEQNKIQVERKMGFFFPLFTHIFFYFKLGKFSEHFLLSDIVFFF